MSFPTYSIDSFLQRSGHMDKLRRSSTSRWAKRGLFALLFVALLVGLNAGVSRFATTVPSVDRRSVVIDTVSFGTFTHEIRGVGQLVASDIIFVPAKTDGRVQSISLKPGIAVSPATVLIRLDNPDLRLALSDAESAVGSAKANLKSQRAILNNQLLALESDLARLNSETEQTQAEYVVSKALAEKGAGSQHQVQLNKIKAAGLVEQRDVADKACGVFRESFDDQLAVHQEAITVAESKRTHAQSEIDSLTVRAGIEGVLAQVLVEVGQQVAAGEDLAKVINPNQLNAELRVSEVQVRYINEGQTAVIDTYNGLVSGRVIRIDPEVSSGSMTIEVQFEEPLPETARADLSVTGMVTVNELNDVLAVGRPAAAMPQSTIEVFRLTDDGTSAVRTPVKVGIVSSNRMVVLDGLNDGDQIILTDLPKFADVRKILID